MNIQGITELANHPKTLQGTIVIALITAIASIWVAYVQRAPDIEDNYVQLMNLREADSSEIRDLRIALEVSEARTLTEIADQLIAFWNVTRDTPTWAKVYDSPESVSKFHVVAYNQRYVDVYGTLIDPVGYSDLELYQKSYLLRGLPWSDALEEGVLQYQGHDLDAVFAGAGKCIVFTEVVFPIWLSGHGASVEVHKCRVDYEGFTFVVGWVPKQTPDQDWPDGRPVALDKRLEWKEINGQFLALLM